MKRRMSWNCRKGGDDNEGIKERTSFRLERRVAAVGRQMGRGNGYLATIRRDFSVRWSVWYGLGHSQQLYWYRANADH